jgi:hypothetical protein
MNNTIKVVGIAALVIVGLAVIGWVKKPVSSHNQVANTQESSGVLTASEQNHDFGAISMKNGNVSHDFAVTNNRQQPVTITKVYTSCMCTTAMVTSSDQTDGPFGMPGHGALPKISQELSPGEQATVAVTFDPNAHGPAGVGRISRVVYLETNTGDTLQLGIATIVTP